MLTSAKAGIRQPKNITSSIVYAQKIQEAIFVPFDNLTSFFSDSSIYFKPRDIVSGDFFWINGTKERVIVIAADCTGHGVPGAFMSMLGVAYLNEIVNKKGSGFNIKSEIYDLGDLSHYYGYQEIDAEGLQIESQASASNKNSLTLNIGESADFTLKKDGKIQISIINGQIVNE